MRNLILTVAANYDLERMAPFLCSWREHASDAELMIFTLDCSEDFYNACRRLDVRTRELTGEWKYSLLVDRHFIFRDFLRSEGHDFTDVLISDARDVIFQANPFRVRRDAAVSFAAEDQIIIKCFFNNCWMTNVYGEATRDAFGQETISCAGTTIGICEDIQKYLELMCLELEQHPEPIVNFGDQACHNYIYYQLRPDFIALDRAGRIVQTLGYTLDGRVSIGEDGVRVDDVAPPIVHQWDRNPTSATYVNARYSLDTLNLSPEPWLAARGSALQRWLKKRTPFAIGRSSRPA